MQSMPGSTTEFKDDLCIAPCCIIFIGDFIGAYAMPHISKNALNVSRASSGILRETPCFLRRAWLDKSSRLYCNSRFYCAPEPVALVCQHPLTGCFFSVPVVKFFISHLTAL